MNQFLDPNYYFYFKPDPNFQFSKLTFGVALGLIVAGAIFAYVRKKVMKDKIARKILRPYAGKLVNYGIALLFLQGFRETGIPYLSMRIWWLIWLLFFLYSALRLVFTYRKEYASRAKMLKKDDKKKDYLPKKKKR